MLFDICIFSVN